MNKILYHYIKLMYHSYRFSTFVFFATNPNFDFCCSQVQFPQNHRSCLRHVFWVRFRFSSSQRWFNFKKWNLLTTCWFRKIIFIDRPRQVQGSKPTRLWYVSREYGWQKICLLFLNFSVSQKKSPECFYWADLKIRHFH